MTQNRRILLNIVATYGRSVYALVLGLFTTRWVLQALGQTDFGLSGVVGGLTSFISFINGVLAYSVGRFFALELGKADVAENLEHGLEGCRTWFSVAVVLHIVVPLILMAIGYPLGEWAVRSYLTIPSDRLDDCVIVFRLACLLCFLGMLSVPFNAMYRAKQFIAELTAYSFVTTTLNAAMLYYMVAHPGVWLVRYAVWTCVLSIAPQTIIIFRAVALFPECRFRWSHCWDRTAYRRLLSYAGWQALGALGALMRAQGLAVLINRYFGPAVNAAMSVANKLNAQACSLSESMLGAFMPAITTAFGAGDLERTRVMALRVCKFSVILSSIFLIPLSLELQTVLTLWLRNPPEYTGRLCLALMVSMIVDRTTIGQMVAIHATGKIAAYQCLLGGALVLTLPLAWLLVSLGMGVDGVCMALVSMSAVCAWGRLPFAARLLGMSPFVWFRSVMMPLCLSWILAGTAGMLVQRIFQPCLGRVVATTFVCEIILAPMTWFVFLSAEERMKVQGKITKQFVRFFAK